MRRLAAASRARDVRVGDAISDLGSFEEFDPLAGAQRHDGLLEAGARALEEAAALRLRLHLDDVHARHLDAEQLLDGLADLRLVRVGGHLERVRAALDAAVALLRQDRREHDLRRVHYCALPWITGSAASVTSSERAQTTAPTSSSHGSTIATRSRLRNDFATFTSSAVQTTAVGVRSSLAATSVAACFVDGRPKAPPPTSASAPAC